ncbi:MAG: 30S ribosomal protein S5, chloroplastic-like, partial [Candidatus Doudnabacteria bacterium Gr01-1014_77]
MARDNKRERSNREPVKRDFEQKVVEIKRVTRVVAGGKRMRFRALVVIGDKKGKVGMGL